MAPPSHPSSGPSTRSFSGSSQESATSSYTTASSTSQGSSFQDSVASRIQRWTASVSGVSDVAADRTSGLVKLGDRCRMIEIELDQRSVGLQTMEVLKAMTVTKSALLEIHQQCEEWAHKGWVRRTLNDDLDSRLVIWNERLSDCMQEFARCIVFEVLNLTAVSRQEASQHYLRLLKQGETLEGLLKSIQRNTDLSQMQLQQLMANAQQVQMSQSAPLSGQDRDELYSALRSILSKSKEIEVLPQVELQGELEVEHMPSLRHHTSDIYKAKWKTPSGVWQTVAVKRLRDPNSSTNRVAKFMYEGYIWRMLKHPNVLPFLGIHTNDRNEIGLVTVWMNHSDVMHYILKHPYCDRRKIITGAADGLAYLHRRGIVHGDIRGSKILIDEVTDVMGVSPQARIADFGLAASSESDQEAVYDGTSASLVTTVCRWLAPERCNNGSESLPVQASDVYSFGRTMLEIITGQKPFPKQKAVFHLIALLCKNELWPERPPREEDVAGILTDDVWQLMMQMWAPEPVDRPTMTEVQMALERIM